MRALLRSALVVTFAAAAFTAGGICAASDKAPPQRSHNAPSHPHALDSTSYHGPKPAGTTLTAHPPTTYTARKQPTVGPVGPGPTHTASTATTTQNRNGIIFVGGHSTHTVPSNGKVELNPQPIPPGH